MTREHGTLSTWRWLAVVGVAASAFGLDRLTKALIQANMEFGQSIPSTGLVRITYTANTGSAFGILAGQGMLLSIISFVMIIGMLYYFRRHPLPGVLPLVSVGLLLGGSVGNLADRLLLGYVVDFIDVGPWPIFNLADSAIVVGVFVLLWVLYQPRKPERVADPESASAGAQRGERREASDQ